MSAGERRIPLGPLVGTIGAVLLTVSLFLDWWEGVTGFTAFEALDLVLLALAVVTALALAGAVLMSAGALVTASRISLAVDVRRREPTRRDPAEAETQRPGEEP